MFKYLTNWGLIFAMISYCLMWLAHGLNGDLRRARYEKPQNLNADNQEERNVFSMDRLPWSFWWVITFTYNLALSTNMVVGIAFWLVEFPAMGMEGYWAALSNGTFLIFWYVHTVPQILLISEWYHSSIRFYIWQVNFGLILLGAYAFFLFYIGTENDEQVYIALNWKDKKTLSTGISIALLGCFFICWHIIGCKTKSKLKKANKKDSSKKDDKDTASSDDNGSS